LVTRHGFDSGNRRTAYAAARLFLARNGEHSNIKHDPNVLQGVREGFYSKKQVIDWLKGHALPAFERAKPIPDNGG
jgi:prophage maintenance system killer protein